MPNRRKIGRRLAYTLTAIAMAATALVAGSHIAQADANPNVKSLLVYDNNIENMVKKDGCKAPDFDHLISYIKKQPRTPDVFTVQQISNTKQLAALTKRLTQELPGGFAGKIAIGDPGSMGYTGNCSKLKNQQTNAVIYRTGRLSPEKVTTWRSDAPKNPTAGTGPCRNLTPTATSQDRVHNVAVRFKDIQAKTTVSIASIHWATNTWHGPECAAENMREADEALDKLGGSLKIIGGDANATPGQDGWWNDARDYGFRDPIAEKCGSPHCSDKYDTNGKRRIDYILVKSGHGFSNVATISRKMAGGEYSDHLALTAYAKY